MHCIALVSDEDFGRKRTTRGAAPGTNNRGGRKPSTAFVHTVIENGVYSCRYCKSVVSGRPLRITAHIEKCPQYKRNTTENGEEEDDEKIEEIPESVRYVENSTIGSFSLANPAPGPSTSGSGTARIGQDAPQKVQSQSPLPSRSKNKKEGVQSYFKVVATKRVDNNSKKRLDVAIAKFFYSANIAFRQIESQSFKNLVKELQTVSGYQPPSRDELANRLLDEVHAEIESEVADSIKNQSSSKAIVLCQDGWSSALNRPITASSICIAQKSFLLSAEESGAERKTSEYCAELAIKEIDDVFEKYGHKVFAICTDNEAKMKKMRSLVKEAKPEILTYGCSAHYLNLVEQAVTPTTALEHIKKVSTLLKAQTRTTSGVANGVKLKQNSINNQY